MLAPFNNRDLPTERQETVVLLHTTDEVKCCALWLWSNSCKISSTEWYWVCLLCDSFCLGSKFFCQTFFLTSIDFSGNTTFPLKANSDSHNFHCFFLFFRGSIDVFNERKIEFILLPFIVYSLEKKWKSSQQLKPKDIISVGLVGEEL